MGDSGPHEALRANSARNSPGGDAMLGSVATELKDIQCLQRQQKDGEEVVRRWIPEKDFSGDLGEEYHPWRCLT